MLGGELALPVDAVPEPFVDVEDVADAAFAALTDDAAHVGRLYEMTGPRALRFAEATAEVARASGRAIRFRSVPAGRARRGARSRRRSGRPRRVHELSLRHRARRAQRRPQPGVQQALGRPPRDFADYARQAAAAGAWS